MGAHLILDFHNVTSIDLDSVEQVDEFLTEVVLKSQATIENKSFKKF